MIAIEAKADELLFKKLAYVSHLYIDEAYRGMRLSSKLMQHVVGIAKRMNVSHLIFYADTQARLFHLYTSHGAKYLGEICYKEAKTISVVDAYSYEL